jgi:FkbM family methyltransferase
LGAIINNKPKVYRWVNGLKFYAQKGDAGIVPNIYFKLFDFEDSKFVLDTLTNEDVFIDIGANVGHFSMLAASKKCEVHAFEPIPTTFKKLQKNIELNNLEVNLYNKGVGAENGVLNFSTQKGVMNSVVNDLNITSKEIEVVKVDDELKNRQPTMLKIDVEGYEWFVLKGAKNILKSTNLKYILIELNESGAKFSITDKQIHELLLENGFYLYSYDYNDKVLKKITTYRKDKFNTLYVKE